MTEENIDPRELIVALRGGIPATCYFCCEETKPENLHPEEGGVWACIDCLKRWQKQESEEP